MGLRGPAPEPTELKKRRGNPGKRPLNTREPKPLVGLPSCPDYLPVEARVIWDRLGSDLLRNGVMTELDGPALADLVETELLNRTLTRELHGSAPVLVRETGENAPESGEDASAKKNPLWALKLDYLRERRAQHQQFGMTPSSRSKITTSPPNEADPIESALH